MFFGPNQIFFGLGIIKHMGNLFGVFWTSWELFFLDLFVLDLGIFFSAAKLIVFELGFCFLDPRTCFVDLGTPLL